MPEVPVRIGDITGNGSIRRPINFRVIYQYPKPASGKLLKLIIGDDTAHILLLYKIRGEGDFDRFIAGQCYQIRPGGYSVKEVDTSFPGEDLVQHPNNRKIWLNNIMKVVPQPAGTVPFPTKFNMPFNFQFTELKNLNNGFTGDILAKVVFRELADRENERGGNIPIQVVQVQDCSLDKNQAIMCNLMGEQAQHNLRAGDIISVKNVRVGSSENNLVITINQMATLFVVSKQEWEWILTDEQRQVKNSIDQYGIGRMKRDRNYDSDENNDQDKVDYMPDDGHDEENNLSYSLVPVPAKRRRHSTSNGRKDVTGTYHNPIICSSIDEVNEALIKNRNDEPFYFRAIDILLMDGAIRRYLGCAKCAKSLRVVNGSYICMGYKCNPNQLIDSTYARDQENERKSFFLLKNLIIKDSSNNELSENLVAYNDVVQQLLSQQADEFGTDSDATKELESLMQQGSFNALIRATPKNGVWDLTVNELAPSENLTPLETISSLRSLAISTNTEEEIRSFLAERTTFKVYVTPSRDINPLINESEEYVHARSPQGLAVHICITKNRQGSKADIKAFESLFGQLHYEVMTFKDICARAPENYKSDPDLTVDNVCYLLECLTWCKKRLIEKNYESFVLCISAHGFENHVLMADDVLVDIWTAIMYRFDDTRFCEFRGRPKFIIINACRSFEELDDDNSGSATATPQELEKLFGTPPPFPNHPDFLMFWATSAGFEARRNPGLGTYFMRTLSYVFMKHAHCMDIRKLFHLVAKILHNPNHPDQYPQIPEVRDFIFSKQFYFRP